MVSIAQQYAILTVVCIVLVFAKDDIDKVVESYIYGIVKNDKFTFSECEYKPCKTWLILH